MDEAFLHLWRSILARAGKSKEGIALSEGALDLPPPALIAQPDGTFEVRHSKIPSSRPSFPTRYSESRNDRVEGGDWRTTGDSC